MSTTKQEFSAQDAAPVVLYAKADPNRDSKFAFPLVATSSGSLSITQGLQIPLHDFISLSPPELPTTIEFRSGGSNGTLVSTVTLTYSGTDIATVTRS